MGEPPGAPCEGGHRRAAEPVAGVPRAVALSVAMRLRAVSGAVGADHACTWSQTHERAGRARVRCVDTRRVALVPIRFDARVVAIRSARTAEPRERGAVSR